MITGDQKPALAAVGFRAAQDAFDPAIGAPQVYPHIGTDVPSGKFVLVGPAVRFTASWA
jgi:hypothetical protein